MTNSGFRTGESGFHSEVTFLLKETGDNLANFLQECLSAISTNWWKDAVLDALSFHQVKRVEQQNINSLASLDLAVLLRVLDQNWHQLSSRFGLTPEARHFAKEMQTVRNRWAHATGQGFPIDDVYRDLDTMQRFAAVIRADGGLLDEFRRLKASLHGGSEKPHSKSEDDRETHETNLNPEAEFALGQIVRVKSDPSIRDAVVAVLPGKPEGRYSVFVAGEQRTYYASQLESEAASEAPDFVTCEKFHANLTALLIKSPALSTLYSLNSARIDFIPYQFRPVLRFIRSDRPRLLIADGVGVGKTIEAGLILRELQARRDIRSVLIVCPRPLVTERKWLNEMKRFEERFVHLDSGTLRYCINEMDLEGIWPEQYQRVIVPYSQFDETLLLGSGKDGKRKRKKGLLDLDPPPRFDLVIVDEAHHIRNQDTFNYKAVRFLCDNAEAAIFLTATPIQLGSHDLFVLLNTLRPDLVIDWESFQHMAAPNPFINQAVMLARTNEEDWQSRVSEALDQATATDWGRAILCQNPDFIRIHSKLSEETIYDVERVRLISDLEAMHTFNGIINRTRRRDIGDFTVRRPETVVVPFTPDQQRLHDQLLNVQAEIFTRLHGDLNVKFMM